MLAASRSSRADSSPPASIVTTASSPVDSSAWQTWVTHAGTGIRKNDSVLGVFQTFQHVTVACYLYLGHIFALYNTFIFVSFLSFLRSTCRHMRPLWPRANGKRAYTCIGLTPRGTWKFFTNNQPLQTSEAEPRKKCLSDSKPLRTFPIFYVWRFIKIYSLLKLHIFSGCMRKISDMIGLIVTNELTIRENQYTVWAVVQKTPINNMESWSRNSRVTHGILIDNTKN